MKRLPFVALLLIALALSACGARPAAQQSQTEALQEIHKGLSSADKVAIYFLNQSDEPNYTVPEFIKQAGITVVRRCGANCANKMRGVIEHFRAAKPHACKVGDQNVMIIVEGLPPLIYSRGGHFIQFREKCYFNQNPVNELLETKDFIFY